MGDVNGTLNSDGTGQTLFLLDCPNQHPDAWMLKSHVESKSTFVRNIYRSYVCSRFLNLLDYLADYGVSVIAFYTFVHMSMKFNKNYLLLLNFPLKVISLHLVQN